MKLFELKEKKDRFLIKKHKFGYDKIYHFLGCYLISYFIFTKTQNLHISILSGVLCAIIEEVIDYYRKGSTADLWDAVYGIIGTLLLYLWK